MNRSDRGTSPSSRYWTARSQSSSVGSVPSAPTNWEKDDGSDAKDGEEEEVQVAREEDPYFARDAAGRRAKRIVEIAELLPKVDGASAAETT